MEITQPPVSAETWNLGGREGPAGRGRRRRPQPVQARCCPQGTRAPAQQRSPAVRSCRPGPFPGTSPAHSPSLADIGPLANHTGGAARPLSSKGELTGSWVFGGVTAGSNQGQRREEAFLLPRGLQRQHPSTLAERGEVAQEGKGWEQALEDSIWQEEGSVSVAPAPPVPWAVWLVECSIS